MSADIVGFPGEGSPSGEPWVLEEGQAAGAQTERESPKPAATAMSPFSFLPVLKVFSLDSKRTQPHLPPQ